MSSDSAFHRWLTRCNDRGGYGATSGDSYWLGMRDYNQPFPCPNGLPVDTRKPHEVPAWRERIERARQFISDCGEQSRIEAMADGVSCRVLDVFLNTLRG